MKFWFAAKRYGWGWVPCSWQGWLVLIAYVVLSLVTFLGIDKHSHSVSDTLIAFVPLFVMYSAILILICYQTGEKPRWRWGK